MERQSWTGIKDGNAMTRSLITKYQENSGKLGIELGAVGTKGVCVQAVSKDPNEVARIIRCLIVGGEAVFGLEKMKEALKNASDS